MNIVVGITGGIAAYKAVGVVRALVLAGHEVHVVATENALRFVGRPTLEAISRNPVHSQLYEGVAEVRHVAIGQAAELIVIAPATANTIAKLAVGLADDLLGNTILSSTAPLVIAPAMHTEMWQHPATQANIATLLQRGVTVVGPASGQLTGADFGPGRMEDADTIVAAALDRISSSRDLAGLRILVTAGGTREPLDPVRFIGNRSSGKQGLAIVEAATRRGAKVTLIAAHLESSLSADVASSIKIIVASTALEVETAVAATIAESDLIIMAAAIADYRPRTISESKLKKDSVGETLELSLVRTPDILSSISASARADQVIVGFAAETEADDAALIEAGRDKLARKGCHYLVLNRVGWDQGFESDTNRIVVLDRAGAIVGEASGSKLAVADHILDLAAARSRRG
ncbi:MAG: bifunctional phosphopantothenoylcysteine decarboxylase/phosphopantothenate--cysteine ligase CoaBC [Salinibacterium sp.]|nr:bifunctional phosphopantothenoylcysteine decarboxylase/phosphopantothenate--cysteine ligase CoaBC [Salinibacterium sp.]